jgi:thiol-disulfide isomerase/thioredoxin
MKLSAHNFSVQAGIEGAEQKLESFLDELTAMEKYKSLAEEHRFGKFGEQAMKAEITPENFNAFKTELKTWINREVPMYSIARTGFVVIYNRYESSLEGFADELIEFVQSEDCTLSAREKRNAIEVIKSHATEFQLYRFAKTAEEVNTPERFDIFKAELKTWFRPNVSIPFVAHIGLAIAERNNVPAEPFVEELIAYVRSRECPMSATEKRTAVAMLEGALRTVFGSDPKLYGKTIDNEDFNWESLRGKYVLIKFTATWCGPCHAQIPGLLEAYEKYHDKGFEIISVYIWERGDAVAGVKAHVEKEKLPWIIISEALTIKEEETASMSVLGSILSALGGQAKPQAQGNFYAIMGVPTMLLVDKEGKIIMTNAVGDKLQSRLAEIFE